MSLTSIVAIDLKGAIGCRNTLPWRLKSDMAFFRERTTGNSVLMGRKTYQSLGGKCLPKRNNVVLSHNAVLFPSSPQCRLALSVEEALYVASDFGSEDNFVIGGAQTYAEFAELVDRYLVTIVDYEVSDADAFLSDDVMSSIKGWDRKRIMEHPASDEDNDHPFAVFEITAPDSRERAQKRCSILEEYALKAAKPHVRSRTRKTAAKRPQAAFAF